MRKSWRLLVWPLVTASLLFSHCESPFQVKEEYSPKLVLYAIAFRGESSLTVRVEANSRLYQADSNGASEIIGLTGTLSNPARGTELQLVGSYKAGLNLLEANLNLEPKSTLEIEANADGFPSCIAALTVLDAATIYPAYWTTSTLRTPGSGQQDPQFVIYPSALTEAIRARLHIKYAGVDSGGALIAGDFIVEPVYQTNVTSYYLRIGGRRTDVSFPLPAYADSFAQVRGRLKSGTMTAMVELVQIDAPIYYFYSISHGFNDPLTMRTEKPLYTNVTGGLGFVGSASLDTLSIRVYP